MRGRHVHAVLDGRAVAGPGAELAEGAEPEHLVVLARDQHGEPAGSAVVEPGTPVLPIHRVVTEDGGGRRDHVVVDRRDAVEVAFLGSGHLHVALPVRVALVCSSLGGEEGQVQRRQGLQTRSLRPNASVRSIDSPHLRQSAPLSAPARARTTFQTGLLIRASIAVEGDATAASLAGERSAYRYAT